MSSRNAALAFRFSALPVRHSDVGLEVSFSGVVSREVSRLIKFLTHENLEYLA